MSDEKGFWETLPQFSCTLSVPSDLSADGLIHAATLAILQNGIRKIRMRVDTTTPRPDGDTLYVVEGWNG